MRRAAFFAVAALVLAMPLASCGKRNDPQPPKDQPLTYPGEYPRDYQKPPLEPAPQPPPYQRGAN
jgi:hypothetical protein